MKHLFLLIMLLPLGFLAAWVGWPWLIVVVSLTVAVYGYLLLKEFPIWRAMVVYSTFFVTEALQSSPDRDGTHPRRAPDRATGSDSCAQPSVFW